MAMDCQIALPKGWEPHMRGLMESGTLRYPSTLRYSGGMFPSATSSETAHGGPQTSPRTIRRGCHWRAPGFPLVISMARLGRRSVIVSAPCRHAWPGMSVAVRVCKVEANPPLKDSYNT